eukprot:gene31799-28908_t
MILMCLHGITATQCLGDNTRVVDTVMGKLTPPQRAVADQFLT